MIFSSMSTRLGQIPQDNVRNVGANGTLVICGDSNGHIGKVANGYEG